MKMPPMFFFLLVLATSARQLVVPSHSAFTFYEQVKNDEIFNLQYSTKTPMQLTLTDPNGLTVYKTSNFGGSFFTMATAEGKMKMEIRNDRDSPCIFYYKCPDTSKELQGNTGHIADLGMVEELSRVFDELVEKQAAFLKQTVEHEKMVESTRFWFKCLMVFEFLVAVPVMYIMHRDLLSMFERKQRL